MKARFISKKISKEIRIIDNTGKFRIFAMPHCLEIGKLNTNFETRQVGFQWRAAPSGKSSRLSRLQRTQAPQILSTGVFSTQIVRFFYASTSLGNRVQIKKQTYVHVKNNCIYKTTTSVSLAY